MNKTLLLFIISFSTLSCKSQEQVDCDKKNKEWHYKFQNQILDKNITDILLDSLSVLNLKCNPYSPLGIVNRTRILEWSSKRKEEIAYLESIEWDSLKNVSSYFKNELRYKLLLLKLNNNDTLYTNNILDDIILEEKTHSNYFTESYPETDSLLFDDFLLENRKLHFYTTNANFITLLESQDSAKSYLKSYKLESYIDMDLPMESFPYKGSIYSIMNQPNYNPMKSLNEIIYLENKDEND